MARQPAPLRLVTSDAGFEAAFAQRLFWSSAADAAIEQRVADILADVQQRGDAAVLEYTRRFDGVQARVAWPNLELDPALLKRHSTPLPAAQRDALLFAAARVRSYHEAQKEACGQSWSYRDADGNLLGQKVTPLDRVGIYVPGGKAAYPSSVLMNAIPAHVAGVEQIIMVVPTPAAKGECRPLGERNPLVLAAAHVAGVSRVFTIGGAQAVAALAYGTQTVPKVDKITGPGNAYVAAAKRRVFGTVGIDMIAGPSEILVLADGSTPPDWVAMDLFSQAEHDELAQSILLCPDAAYIDQVQAVDRPAVAVDGAARDHRQPRSTGAVRWCRRAPWRRPAPSATGSRPSTWKSAATSRIAGSRCCAMPERSSWAPIPARAWATTAPVPTMCCRPVRRRGFPARSGCTISRSAAA